MEKSFSSLLSQICEVRLDYRRINDVTINNGDLMIAFYEVKDLTGKVEVKLCLRDTNKNEYALSIRQLAALRIQVGTVKAEWLDDFKTDDAGSTFQSVARKLVDEGKSLEGLKFKVVKQLKVKNNQITASSTPIYKDFCYEGVSEYTKSVRALLNGKTNDFFQTPEYGRSMAEIREKLHSSPLKSGQGIEANLVLLPLFQVS